jgi:hypothetical protein
MRHPVESRHIAIVGPSMKLFGKHPLCFLKVGIDLFDSFVYILLFSQITSSGFWLWTVFLRGSAGKSEACLGAGQTRSPFEKPTPQKSWPLRNTACSQHKNASCYKDLR